MTPQISENVQSTTDEYRPENPAAESSSFNMKNAVEGKHAASNNHTLVITDKEHKKEPSFDEIQGENERVLSEECEGPTHSRKLSSSLALERYNSEQHKSLRDDRKRLGARNTLHPGFSSASSCSAGCICACHAVKGWGRWALHFPHLATLLVTHRGVTKRIPCSNPRCQSNSFQEKLVRMDIYPSMWLLRATISVFLSFGLPSPELLIRVNKVIEYTDVHSYMNQLLWAIQREESHGVKHFLQSRLVRADDIYGEPLNGFTPLRLALDRKSKEVASLL